MNIFSDSIQLMEKLLRKSKKVKRGATLEEAEIDGAWLIAYAQIARRCRDDKDLGVSRYPYELAPGVSPFSGGYFEHREWAIRRGMERHPSLRPLKPCNLLRFHAFMPCRCQHFRNEYASCSYHAARRCAGTP
jgi:hypothetical protein